LNDNSIIEKTRDYVEGIFKERVGEEYSYHNFTHTSRVVDAAFKLADKAGLDKTRKEILILAAYFHDVGFSVDPDKHEDCSKKMAMDFLSAHNYPPQQIDTVLKCIDATKMQWRGSDHLCLMMKDADLSGLASSEYESISENLKKEEEFRKGESIAEESWIKKNIAFLKNHNYLSEEGRALFSEGKKKNLKKLKKAKGGNNSGKVTISKNKSAQTQFKTALRNHIDLSAIADNKANIMLSVNAVIITVGLPLLIDKALSNPMLYLPTAILAVTSLLSMIFATLSTRPIRMTGLTSIEEIKHKRTNLFFFGNYYNMRVEDYESAVDQILSDNSLLDNSIIRDLFFLGKSLGRKFAYLRWCYNIFMYGIALTVISYAVSFLL